MSQGFVLLGALAFAAGLSVLAVGEMDATATILCYTDPGCEGYNEFERMSAKYDAAKARAWVGIMVAVAGGSTAVAGILHRAKARSRDAPPTGPGRCGACRAPIPRDALACERCGARLVTATR